MAICQIGVVQGVSGFTVPLPATDLMTPETLASLKHFLDRHPNRFFRSYGSLVWLIILNSNDFLNTRFIPSNLFLYDNKYNINFEITRESPTESEIEEPNQFRYLLILSWNHRFGWRESVEWYFSHPFDIFGNQSLVPF